MATSDAEVVRQFWSDVNSGGYEAVERLVAFDYIDRFPADFVSSSGREGLQQTFQVLRRALSNLRFSVEAIIAEDETVLTRFTARGHHTGVYMGTLPSGMRIEMMGLYLCRVDRGFIVEGGMLLDDMGLLRQAREPVVGQGSAA